MCRLFGQISLEPDSALPGLAGDPRSLLALSLADPRRRQKDGWGIGWYAPRARLVKSVRPAFAESGRLVAAASRARSRIVIGHIRAASNPMGLPPDSIRTPAERQPFRRGEILFAHNGTLNIAPEVIRALGARARGLEGNNDSEVYFRQFLKFLDLLGDPAEALKACVRETRSLWEGCRGRYPSKKLPYTGLNALVSDGMGLYALCHYPGPVPGWTALADPSREWGTMSLSRADGAVLIASEDLSLGRWEKLRPPEVVSVLPERGRLTLRRERFYPA